MLLAENNQPLSQAVISHIQQHVMTSKHIRQQKWKLCRSFLIQTPNLYLTLIHLIKFQTHITPQIYHLGHIINAYQI